jgi:RHS repeat-associated protein
MQLAFNGSGTLTDRYLWGPLVDEVLAQEAVSSTSSPGTVGWVATEDSVTDVWQAGTSFLSAHTQYNAFGGIASETSSGFVPFGYDGEYTDPATGMQYHNDPTTGKPGRWYLPWAERWASEDPIFPLSGSNPDEFCNNSPTNFIDPSGLISTPVAGQQKWARTHPHLPQSQDTTESTAGAFFGGLWYGICQNGQRATTPLRWVGCDFSERDRELAQLGNRVGLTRLASKLTGAVGFVGASARSASSVITGATAIGVTDVGDVELSALLYNIVIEISTWL